MIILFTHGVTAINYNFKQNFFIINHERDRLYYIITISQPSLADTSLLPRTT